MPSVPMVPATNEPMAAVASAAPARPVAGHLVALERGDDGGALARRVEQDRGGRAAIHRAVVDAGEQDEGGGRLDLEGDRQQQRDGERRAEAGQHADRGAERGADEAPHQVDRRERDREAVEELREGVHLSLLCEPMTRSIAFSTRPAPMLMPSVLAKPK